MAGAAFRTARIELPKTAFFLCDMQERFRTAIANFDLITNTSARMLRAASILDVPVFTTEQNPKALGATVAPLNDLVKQLPELSSKAVHPKTKFSMDLPGITDAWLKSAGDIKHVVIFGIESHVCVLQTTLDLLERGIQVHVIKDGVSSCNVGEIDVALEVSLPPASSYPSARSHAHSDPLLLTRCAAHARLGRKDHHLRVGALPDAR